MHLQEIANRLPNTFNDAANVTKSHVPTINAPARINIRIGQSQNIAVKESAIRQKLGRPIGSNDSAPRKRRNERSPSCPPEEARNPPEEVPPEEAHNPPEEIPPEEASNAPEEVMVKFVLSRIVKVPGEILEAPEEAPVLDNEEIFILCNYSRERWNRNDDDWDTGTTFYKSWKDFFCLKQSQGVRTQSN